jgi:hypothetical protein
MNFEREGGGEGGGSLSNNVDRCKGFGAGGILNLREKE